MINRIIVCFIIAVVAVTATEARQIAKGSTRFGKQEMSRMIKYRVARSERTVSGPPTLVAYISINSRHFNREDIVFLARQLKQDFAKEPRLTVLIFSDYNAAKSLVFSVEQPSTYERDKAALRGGYNLDRVAGTESVSFSADATRPHDEIRIDLKD